MDSSESSKKTSLQKGNCHLFTDRFNNWSLLFYDHWCAGTEKAGRINSWSSPVVAKIKLFAHNYPQALIYISLFNYCKILIIKHFDIFVLAWKRWKKVILNIILLCLTAIQHLLFVSFSSHRLSTDDMHALGGFLKFWSIWIHF